MRPLENVRCSVSIDKLREVTKLKKSLLVLVVLVLALSLTVTSYANDKVFKVGGISSLQTGYGRSMVSGAGLAIEEINAAGGIDGIMLSIEWEDGMLSPAIGRTGVQKLLYSDNVDALIGDHSSATIIATDEMVREYGLLQLGMGSAMQVTALGNPWIARVREPDNLTARVLLNYITETLGYDKIAVFYVSDQFGFGGRDVTLETMKEMGLEPVSVESHNPNDKDFSAQLLAFRNAGAQAIIAYSAPVEVGVFLRQAKQLIPDVKVFQSSVGATQTSMEVAGDAANGTYAVVTYTEDNPDPKVQEFVAAHVAKYKDVPYDFFDPLAYDAIYMLAEAIRIAGTTDRAAVRDAFFTIKGFKGVTGLEYNVMPNGETINELLLVEIVDGKHRVVDRVQGN